MTIKQTLVERVRADRGRGWDNGSTISWTLDIVPLVDAYDALLTEVERLRAQRILSNEDFARSFDMGLAAGERRERAAVVAWLRERQEAAEWALTAAGYEHAADAIERGEHRREEER